PPPPGEKTDPGAPRRKPEARNGADQCRQWKRSYGCPKHGENRTSPAIGSSPSKRRDDHLVARPRSRLRLEQLEQIGAPLRIGGAQILRQPSDYFKGVLIASGTA